jgi:hypothetical protein
MALLATNRDDAVLAYLRRPDKSAADCHQSGSALVLLNFSDQAIDLRLSAVSVIPGMPLEIQLQDRMTGEYFTNPASKPLLLEPFGVRILTAETSSCD